MPWSAATEPPEDAVDDRAVLLRRSSSTTVLRLDRQQALQNSPFRFGQIASAQARLQKAALNQPRRVSSIASATPRLHGDCSHRQVRAYGPDGFTISIDVGAGRRSVFGRLCLRWVCERTAERSHSASASCYPDDRIHPRGGSSVAMDYGLRHQAQHGKNRTHPIKPKIEHCRSPLGARTRHVHVAKFVHAA